jgi:predicted nucleotidyltransferase
MGTSVPYLGIVLSIVDFMFSPVVQKVLSLVYSTPEQTFMLNDLLDRAGGGRGNGQRQVQRLIDAGVLREEPRRGHQRAIRANADFALYPELLSICRKSFGLVEPIRDALRPFESEIAEAFVFGSVAKDKDTHRSDIDLMVVGTASMMDLMDAILKVEKVLGRPVHLNVYAPDEWADLKANDPVVSKISTDSIVRILPDAKAS